MARIIKKRSKKRGGKKATRKATVKTVTKRVYVKAKKAKRKFRRVASERMGTKDIVLSVAGAGVGGIGGAFILTKIPAAVPPVAANGALAALGGVAAGMGVKKKNRLLMGLGLGVAAVGVRGLIANFVPTLAGYDDTPVYLPATQMAAPFAGELAAPFAGECMAAPFDGDGFEEV